ncbi:MAG: hypothetical protein JWR69_369 [Pedosphaera sp.]|nr:hypothetical protein [Pedosphaera sp.]
MGEMLENQDGKPVARTKLSILVLLRVDYFFFLVAFLAFFLAATNLTSDQLGFWIH